MLVIQVALGVFVGLLAFRYRVQLLALGTVGLASLIGLGLLLIFLGGAAYVVNEGWIKQLRPEGDFKDALFAVVGVLAVIGVGSTFVKGVIKGMQTELPGAKKPRTPPVDRA